MDELFVAPEQAEFPLSLHREFLADRYRVGRFEQALAEVVRPGDCVVDVGCGTGILAFLALRAGAGRVIGIERSPLADLAEETRLRSFPDAPVEFHRLDAFSRRLPRVRADVVVGELLGNFGIEENLVRIMASLRRRLLVPGGVLVPGRLALEVAAIESAETHAAVDFWRRRRYGIDFSPFARLAANSVYHLTGQHLRLLSPGATVAEIDLYRATRRPHRLSGTLAIRRGGRLHGFAGWFDSQLSAGVRLTTHPRRADTHWGQVYFPLGRALRVDPGDRVRIEIQIVAQPECDLWSWSGEVSRRGRGDVPFHAAARRTP